MNSSQRLKALFEGVDRAAVKDAALKSAKKAFGDDVDMKKVDGMVGKAIDQTNSTEDAIGMVQAFFQESITEVLDRKTIQKVSDFMETGKNRNGTFDDILKDHLIETVYNGDTFEFEADPKAESKIESLRKAIEADLLKSIALRLK